MEDKSDRTVFEDILERHGIRILLFWASAWCEHKPARATARILENAMDQITINDIRRSG